MAQDSPQNIGRERTWKIGELAEQTGLTVRALHHYEEVGLPQASHRAANGYRRYTKQDIDRLQQIVSLKQLGFSLEEIETSLAQPDFSSEKLLE